MNPAAAFAIRVVLTILGTAVTFLPRGVELILGPGLGRLFLVVDRKRRRIAYNNIRRCLPKLGTAGWNALLKENYAHYGVLALEILHMFSPLPGHYRRYARTIAVVDGFENWKKVHDRGKGTVIVSAHLANWELMAAAGAMAGVPITMATRYLKPEWLHRKIEAARRSVEVRAAYLPDTLPAILRALRKGESAGFVLDQYAPPPMGIPVPFFGVKVDTLASVGTLAERYDAPIIPVSQYRDPEGIVHIRFEPELNLGPLRRDPEKATAAMAAKVESWIRACPAQWLWVHRRFKNVTWPDEAAASSAAK